MNVKELLINIIKPVNIPLTRFILKRHYQANKELSNTKNAKRILILAPHMDDETIGPGGVIRKHANEGAEVHCALITDGSNSVSDLNKEELTNVRMNEMNEVKNILGINTLHYMGLPDGRVQRNQESQRKFMEIIQSIKPDIIYCTPYIDAHPDHIETAGILADALKQINYNDVTVRLYEINCPIPPNSINCVIDISDTFSYKKRAVEVFASQKIAFDGFLELNSLKSNLVPNNVKMVEVFMELPIEVFINHCQNLEQQKNRFPQLFKQANRTDTLLWAIYKNLKFKQQLYEDSLEK